MLLRALADMNAVESVAELFEMGLGVESCTQGGGLSLYCHANHQHAPMNGKKIDWAQVTRLKVVQIGGDK